MSSASRVVVSILLAAWVPCVRADLRYAMRINVGESAGSTMIYMRRGADFRSENADARSGGVTLFLAERHAMYRLDEQAKQYVEAPGPDWVQSLAMSVMRRPRIHESGKRTDIYYETFDTGERRIQFGLATRHLILRERTVAQPGACSVSLETEREGWYGIPQKMGTDSGLMSAHLVGSDACRDTIAKHGAEAYPGLAFEETTRTRSPQQHAGMRDYSMHQEVLEFSRAPLDPRLFAVPEEFQRVEALPGDPVMGWAERWASEWGLLGRAVESWFE